MAETKTPPITKPEEMTVEVGSPAALLSSASAPVVVGGVDLNKAATAEEFADKLAEAITAVASKAANNALPYVPRVVVDGVVSEIVKPLVDTLGMIIAHIGMSIPEVFGGLVEKIEGFTKWDLNGDGFIGDPEKASDAKSA